MYAVGARVLRAGFTGPLSRVQTLLQLRIPWGTLTHIVPGNLDNLTTISFTSIKWGCTLHT